MRCDRCGRARRARADSRRRAHPRKSAPPPSRRPGRATRRRSRPRPDPPDRRTPARRRTGRGRSSRRRRQVPRPTHSPPARRRWRSSCSASHLKAVERLVDQAGIIAGIEHDVGPSVASGRRYGISSLATRLRRRTSIAINPQSRRDRVHQPLAHERALEPSRGAIGAAGRLVGEADMADRPIGRHAIRPRQHCGREIGHAWRRGCERSRPGRGRIRCQARECGLAASTAART